MRRGVFLLFLVGCLFLTCARAEDREATIMVYLCGSDLESEEAEASGDLREMIQSGVGRTEGVDVIVATGGSRRWNAYGIASSTVQYYRLGAREPELLKDTGRNDMGRAETLSAFLRFSREQFPAERYVLVLWDHGGGPVFGLCYDENYSDDELTMQELRTGLQNGLGGDRLAVIAYDACLMNSVDICALNAEFADYQVVSQELVSGTGLNYDEWIGAWCRNPAMSSLDVAREISRTYIAENSTGRRGDTATMSVIESSAMGLVTERLEQFSAALEPYLGTNLPAVVRARQNLLSFGEFLDYDASDLVDIQDLCDGLRSLIPEACDGLSSAAMAAVAYNVTSQDISAYAHGLSLFLPYATVGSDQSAIRALYGNQNSRYASLVMSMMKAVQQGGYSMNASAYSASNFYTQDSQGCYGEFASIWDGWYGDSCSSADLYDYCDGNIWSGLSGSCGGSIWDDLSSACGGSFWDDACQDNACSIWDGYDGNNGYWSGGNIWGGLSGSGSGGGYTESGTSVSAADPQGGGIWSSSSGSGSGGGYTESGTSVSAADTQGGGIWSGLNGSGDGLPQLSDENQQNALINIWAGLLNQGNNYYTPTDVNSNVQEGISDPVTPQQVVETADVYFSASSLTRQSVYTIQLTREDLDHLAAASGVLIRRNGEGMINLGNLGVTVIDWSTGLIYSMFDGSWPMLQGQMVRAEALYGGEDGSVRIVMPARVNGIRMYVLAVSYSDGHCEVLGVTQGYDENGYAIRGSMPLEPGMVIQPVFTCIHEDGSETESLGETITVGDDGLNLVWDKVTGGSYEYCFGLKDLSGKVHYTDTVPLLL